MCEEESDDQEAVAKLFEINDSIHRTIERYKLMKKGDIDAASKIPQGTLGTSTGVGKTADNELSLIDFGGDIQPEMNGSSSGSADLLGSQQGEPQKQDSLEDDLLGLSFQDKNYGQGGGIALGFGANHSRSFQHFQSFDNGLSGHVDVPGPSLLSSTLEQSSAKAPNPIRTPQPPQSSQPMKPNYDAFASLTSSRPTSQSTTPAPSLRQQQQAMQIPQNSDPFAALSANIPRQGSPFTKPQSDKPPPASIFDFASSKPQPTSTFNQTTNGSSTDDDWNFSSALPEDASLPSAMSLTVSDKEVMISFNVSRRKTDEAIVDILASFSNKSGNVITEYTFQVAVTKVECPYNEATEVYAYCADHSNPGIFAQAHSSVWPKASALSSRWNNPANRDPRSRQGAGSECQDPVESILQGRR